MKEMNKVLVIIVIAIFCVFVSMCKVVSVFEYINLEKQLFLDNQTNINKFKNHFVDDAYIFLWLPYNWDTYSINFSIFKSNVEIQKLNISNIYIMNNSNKVIFTCSGIDFDDRNLAKGDNQYRKSYNLYGVY